MDSGHGHVGRFQYSIAESYGGNREQGIRVSIRPGERCVMQPVGDVDMLTAPALDKAVAESLVTRPRVLILDLSEVTFLASTGLATLLHAREGCRAAGTALRLVGTGQQVLRPMVLTGLIRLFDVYPDLESALHGPVSDVEG